MTQLLRTTWLFSASKPLHLLEQASGIRRMPAFDTAVLKEKAQKRNVFARHSWENSFYLQRIAQLENATVIEISIPGEFDPALPIAQAKADALERIAFISTILSQKRKQTQQALAISKHRRYGFDVAISPGFQYLHSSQRPEANPRGIDINDTFVRRFNRCGFPKLVQAVTAGTELGYRLLQTIGWLFESRQETSIEAAVVKTAIALESLLIASDSENLRGPLAERAAFLLADNSNTRRQVAKQIKSFYDLRSGIVHGGRRKRVTNMEVILEGIDRLTLLLVLTIASKTVAWESFASVVAWVEDRKWGTTAEKVALPFPGSHLSRALNLLGDCSSVGTTQSK